MWWLFVLGLLDLALSESDGVLVAKHSFKPPYVSVGTRRVAYWDTLGSTVVKDNFIQLTPDEVSQSGAIWNQKANSMVDWEVVIGFVVGKATATLGADGLTFWYTKRPGKIGSVFGNQDNWNGAAIFFDTFDNEGNGDNPSVYLIMNDGSHSFSHGSDGKPAVIEQCNFNYRTLNYDALQPKPTYAKIRYEKGILSLQYDWNSMYGGEPNWRTCFSTPLKLDKNGFFGVSAATGGVSDHHDIISFQTYNLGNVPIAPTENTEPVPTPTPPVQPAAQRPKGPRVETATEDPAATDLNFMTSNYKDLYDIEKKQGGFTATIKQQFSAVKERLNSLETQATDALNGVMQSIEDMTRKIGEGDKSVDVFKNDMAKLTSTIQELQAKLETVSVQVQDAKQQADHLRNMNKMRGGVLHDVVEGHSWGFWLFFGLFQLFFCFAAFSFKKIQDEKNKDYQL